MSGRETAPKSTLDVTQTTAQTFTASSAPAEAMCSSSFSLVAQLGTNGADRADQARPQSLADTFRSAASPQDRRKADSRFHIGLAVAAQSNRLTTATVQVQGEMAPLLWASDPAEQLLRVRTGRTRPRRSGGGAGALPARNRSGDQRPPRPGDGWVGFLISPTSLVVFAVNAAISGRRPVAPHGRWHMNPTA